MQQVQSDTRTLAIEPVVTSALEHLEELGYSGRSRKNYRRVWASLIGFARITDPMCTRVRDLEAAFLASSGIEPGKRCDLSWSQRENRRVLFPHCLANYRP
jgi:hypothetical protein